MKGVKMYQDRSSNNIEVGKLYKLGDLYEYILEYNYHIYSNTIQESGFAICNSTQKLCLVDQVINHEYICLMINDARKITSPKVNGIIFAEYA